MPSLPDHAYLGVFDGHGGAGAAIYVEANIIGVIESIKEYKDYVAGGAKSPELLGVALQEAFLLIDANLRVHSKNLPPTDAVRGNELGGCTATTCMITPTHFVCANAGDSRTVLGTAGTAVPLSFDHKPTNDEERSRIEYAGGTVQW